FHLKKPISISGVANLLIMWLASCMHIFFDDHSSKKLNGTKQIIKLMKEYHLMLYNGYEFCRTLITSVLVAASFLLFSTGHTFVRRTGKLEMLNGKFCYNAE